jgi:uncharacterized Rmd1/YagE family protein
MATRTDQFTHRRRRRSLREKFPTVYDASNPATTNPLVCTTPYPLLAMHVAKTIDLQSPWMESTLFASSAVRKQQHGRNSVVFQLPPSDGKEDKHKYVTCFRFGSVVFLNVPPKEVSNILWELKRSAVDPVKTGLERRESFGVLVASPQHEYSGELGEDPFSSEPVVTGDYCVVPELVSGLSPFRKDIIFVS